MMNRFIAYNMPKIELHCHLDGSMSVELTQKLLADMGEEYTKEELQEALTAPMDCPSLADYLKRFDLPLRCLQTKEGLRAAAEELALRAAKDPVLWDVISREMRKHIRHPGFVSFLSGQERMTCLLPFIRENAVARLTFRRQSSMVQEESGTESL